jgi:hypothetical protein
MRAILVILILVVVAAIAAVQSGVIDISQTRPATSPSLAAQNGSVSVKPGQPPAFEVQTGSIGVGTREANVAVPRVTIDRDGRSVRVPAIEVRRPGATPPAAPAEPAPR